MKKLLKQQFGHPSGVLGQIAGWIMALQNRNRTEWVVEQINAKPDDRILELGIGPGVAIQLLAEVVLDGYIAGVDSSSVMIDHATNRNYSAIQRGRVDIRLASVENLPFDDGYFDKIFTVNSLHHWENAELGLKEAFRALKVGGQITIVEQPRMVADEPNLSDTIAERITSQLAAIGFKDFTVSTLPTESTPVVCVRAIK